MLKWVFGLILVKVGKLLSSTQATGEGGAAIMIVISIITTSMHLSSGVCPAFISMRVQMIDMICRLGIVFP